jgi:hypothetical protein
MPSFLGNDDIYTPEDWEKGTADWAEGIVWSTDDGTELNVKARIMLRYKLLRPALESARLMMIGRRRMATADAIVKACDIHVSTFCYYPRELIHREVSVFIKKYHADMLTYAREAVAIECRIKALAQEAKKPKKKKRARTAKRRQKPDVRNQTYLSYEEPF